MTATTVTPRRVTVTTPPPPPRLAPWRRPVISCLVLLVAYVGLSFANNPHAFLGTDTGGKVTHGVDGLLLPPDAAAGAWRAALRELDDPDRRRSLAEAGTRRVWAQHAEFAAVAEELVA